MRVIVTGAGGFIGNHLVNYLKHKKKVECVVGIDIKKPEFDYTSADEFHLLDLRSPENCMAAMLKIKDGADRVYHLAANMGGIGFIESHKAEISHDNTLINVNTIEAARKIGVKRFLFSSSACVYPGYKQNEPDVKPLREEDAYPADAEDGYGWEKLMMERLCRHYREDYGLDTRIVRFHNIYGPKGTWRDGREKAPAAICRKVGQTGGPPTINIWGDGKQTRSFCYVDDCVEGLWRLMESNYVDPMNLGRDDLVSIDQLVDIVCKIAGRNLVKTYNQTAPQGVRGRNSDNSLMRKVLDWEPQITLEQGLYETYHWIRTEMIRLGVGSGVSKGGGANV